MCITTFVNYHRCYLTTFNNISVISWWSVLTVGETGGPGEGGSEYVASNCDKKKTLFRWVHHLFLPLEIWKFNMHIKEDLLFTYSLPPSPGPPVSPTIKTDHHDITEILLKVIIDDNSQMWLCTFVNNCVVCYYRHSECKNSNTINIYLRTIRV